MIDLFEYLPKRVIDSEYAGQLILSALAVTEMATASAAELAVGSPGGTINDVIYGGGMGVIGNCVMTAALMAGQKKFNKNV